MFNRARNLLVWFWKRLTNIVSLIAMIFFTSFSIVAKRNFTLPKNDFVAQFGDSALEKLYCYNDNGDKLLLGVNSNTLLILKLNSGKEKKVVLETVKYRKGLIEAFEINPWWPGKIKTFNISDVSGFEVTNQIQSQKGDGMGS